MVSHARPLVLVTTASRDRDQGLRRQDAVTGRNYSQALRAEGALPVMAANLDVEAASELIERVDGLLLSGGADVAPERFAQAPHPGLGVVDEERDAFEIALYRAARARGLPVFGICRGIQLVNVAEGGTLHQHLPALAHAIQHDQRSIDGRPHHAVTLDGDSKSARAAGSTTVMTNSFHHQAVDTVAPSLRATGRTTDGIVEVLEGTSGAWLLCVEWHPEMMYATHPESRWPFRAFVEALGDARAEADQIAAVVPARTAQPA
ncbi:MAG: gamma-glutamyl-gamma-aminobutyrate hydrolase family protein [Trueperaceae bacterium]|nr:gamma-glutamyl-gamma-aminobutyrate hydrolase family protein [Trueperaceae bacterium]